MAADLRAETWPLLEAESGLTEAQMRAAGEVYIGAEKVIVCWGMGITQHRDSVATIQLLVDLLMLRGNLGRPGAGACPVRGHSNVQGDRTMGIWERPSAAFLDRLGREFGFEPPRAHGFSTVEAIEAMHRGDAKVLLALGGNFLSATPDTAHVAQALRRCRLTVQVSTKLNRSHLVTGAEALILPCLGRTERDVQRGGEQFVTVEDSMGVVHASRGRLPPASPDLLSEPTIVARLATAALGERSQVPWLTLVSDYDRIRDEIAAVVPDFHDFNQRVRQPGGFVLRNAAREREFRTGTGKARFFVHQQPPLDLPAGQLRLMTLRSHDQYNTTIYGLDDRYRGVFGLRTPSRPNPIAITAGKLLSVKDNVLEVQAFDAFAGTPILDIKPYGGEDMMRDWKQPEWRRGHLNNPAPNGDVQPPNVPQGNRPGGGGPVDDLRYRCQAGNRQGARGRGRGR